MLAHLTHLHKERAMNMAFNVLVLAICVLAQVHAEPSISFEHALSGLRGSRHLTTCTCGTCCTSDSGGCYRLLLHRHPRQLQRQQLRLRLLYHISNYTCPDGTSTCAGTYTCTCAGTCTWAGIDS